MAETPQEIVDRELREFKRYTGDGLPGEPVGAPLPVGDPQSGAHNPKKANLRRAMKVTLEGAGEAVGDAEDQASYAQEWAQSPNPISVEAGGDGASDRSSKWWAGQAEDSADRAETYAAMLSVDKVKFNTVAALLADTSVGYAGSGAAIIAGPGDIIEAQGFRYEVAASDATDSHVETAGGVKLNVLGDVLRPEMLGISANAVVDQNVVLQKLFDIGSPEIYLPSGRWRSDSDLTRNTDIIIRGPGTLDFSHGDGQLLIEGTLTELPGLSANVAYGDDELTFPSAPDLELGDVVVLWNDTPGSWVDMPNRAYYYDGAMFEVQAVDGAVVRSTDIAVDPYNAASFRVFRLRGPKVRLSGIGIIPPSSGNKAAVKHSLCKDVKIDGLSTARGGVYAGVHLDRCYSVNVDTSGIVNDSGQGNTDYGIIVGNTQHITIKGTRASSTRHAVALGGANIEGAVPTRWVKIIGMDLRSELVSSADAHGNCDFITYDTCSMNGVGQGGRNIRVQNCVIFPWKGNTAHPVVYMTELVGGTLDLLNNTYIVPQASSPASHGFMRMQISDLREDLTINVIGGHIRTPQSTGSNPLIAVLVADDGSEKVNVRVDGITWQAPAGQTFLAFSKNTGNPLASDYCIVDNVVGPSGAQLLYPHGTQSGVPMRMMRQGGSVVITTTAASAANASPQSFRHPYPKAPTHAQVSIQSEGSNSYLTAGQPASPKVYGGAATQITPAMVAPANFNAGQNVRLHWSVGIDEV